MSHFTIAHINEDIQNVDAKECLLKPYTQKCGTKIGVQISTRFVAQ